MFTNKRPLQPGVIASSKKQQVIKATKQVAKQTIKKFVPIASNSDLTDLVDIFDISKDKQVLMLSGPIGCGKTYAVEEMSKRCDFQLNCFDPSDNSSIEQDLRSISSTKSYFTKNPSSKRVILVDNAEGLTETQHNGLVSYLTKHHNMKTCCSIIIIYTHKTKNIQKLAKFATKHVVMIAPTPEELQFYGRNVKSITLHDVYECSHACNGDIRQFRLMAGIIGVNEDGTDLYVKDKSLSMEEALKTMLAYPSSGPEVSEQFHGAMFPFIGALHNTLMHLHANKDFSVESLANTLESTNSASYGEYGNYIIGMVPSVHNIPYTNQIKTNNVQIDKQAVQNLSDSYKLYVS